MRKILLSPASVSGPPAVGPRSTTKHSGVARRLGAFFTQISGQLSEEHRIDRHDALLPALAAHPDAA